MAETTLNDNTSSLSSEDEEIDIQLPDLELNEDGETDSG